MINAREAALLTLYEIFYKGAYSNLALKEMMARCSAMSRNDKNLFTTLVYGTVSRHYTLEYAISRFSNIKPKKIANYVKLILETGFYQLMYLDRIPDGAAVNESVKLAKKYGRKGSERFVNGVMRAFCRASKSFEPPRDDRYLRVKYSFPDEIVNVWCEEYGTEFAENLMAASNEPPPLTLRANTLKITPEDLAKRLAPYNSKVLPSGLVSVSGIDIAADGLYLEGAYTVQDAAAFCAAKLLDPKAGETIIDMCAAPGGKTAHIAELTGDKANITAFDIYEHKIEILKSNMRRLGITSVTACVRDASVFAPELKGGADRVLCDVPCSGWGVIRRKPDIKLMRHENNSDLTPVQSRILENAAEYLKSGGTLMYSTCTLRRSENEDITDSFLRSRPDFKKEYEKTFFPNVDNSDGFYICKMRKL